MTLYGPPELSDTVANFAFPVTLRRYGAPTFANGLAASADPTESTIQAHMYPAPARVADQLANQHGIEVAAVFEGHSSEPLSVGDESTQTLPDEIRDQVGDTYRVFKTAPRPSGTAGALTWQTFWAAKIVP